VDASVERIGRRVVVGALALMAGVGVAGRVPLAAQERGVGVPPLVIASMSGRDLFDFYCASCHGRDGRGHGPVAVNLKAAPPDLTVLARAAGGVFPRAAVRAFVTGDAPRPAASHGTKEMPVWGPVFNGLDTNEARNRVRLDNIVGYIESIQVPR
jgi:mono/diheme cytochrome c family protein